jgi:hypothetical protein
VRAIQEQNLTKAYCELVSDDTWHEDHRKELIEKVRKEFGDAAAEEKEKNYKPPSREDIQAICGKLATEKLGPCDPEPEKLLAREFTQAVRKGDIRRIHELCKLYELHERNEVPSPRERQTNPKSWLYYTAVAAHKLLRKGTLPTKKQVKEQALWERVLYEIPKDIWGWSPKDIEIALRNKTAAVSRFLPKNWRQIFNALSLSDLPKAPTHSPQ